MIHIGGSNNYFQIVEKTCDPNREIIRPPQASTIDPYSVLSYSFCRNHSVLIKRDGTLLGIGVNTNCEICGSLPREELHNFTEFRIQDSEGNRYFPVSAVCGSSYTLYLVSKTETGEKLTLAYSCGDSDSKTPTFLNVGDSNPLALFGGNQSSAAIDSTGKILFIPYNTKSDVQINPISLPNDDKAINVAFADDYDVYAIGKSGKLYHSSENGKLNFKQVDELNNFPIVSISAFNKNCLAVASDGRVFATGPNKCGQIGMGKDLKDSKRFTDISALHASSIKAAYAGCNYSLFQTKEGKILACGANDCGQLLLSSENDKDNAYFPKSTVVEEGGLVCIAGYNTSAVFTGIAPPNMPNKSISEERKIEMPITVYELEVKLTKLYATIASHIEDDK